MALFDLLGEGAAEPYLEKRKNGLSPAKSLAWHYPITIYFLTLKNYYSMIRYKVISRKNPQTHEKKFYGTAAEVLPVDLNTVANEISNTCTLTVHDIKAVMSALEEAVYNHLLQGQSIRFGDLGSFHARMSSKGAETPEKFTSSMVRGLLVRFTPSANLRKMLNLNATYQRMADPETTQEEEGE